MHLTHSHYLALMLSLFLAPSTSAALNSAQLDNDGLWVNEQLINTYIHTGAAEYNYKIVNRNNTELQLLRSSFLEDCLMTVSPTLMLNEMHCLIGNINFVTGDMTSAMRVIRFENKAIANFRWDQSFASSATVGEIRDNKGVFTVPLEQGSKVNDYLDCTIPGKDYGMLSRNISRMTCRLSLSSPAK